MEKIMATIQSNGSSSVTSTSTKNNSGSFITSGTSTGSTKLIAQQSASAQVGVFSSTVYDNSSADKALSGGTFAFNNSRPTAMKTTTTLAGVSKPFLSSGANDTDNKRSIHKLEKIRTRRITTAIRNNKWNQYSGSWDAGFPVNAVDDFWSLATASGSATSTDHAAAPTMSVPGEMTYKLGNPVPVLADYKPKTN
jgi:hypothetical protein